MLLIQLGKAMHAFTVENLEISNSLISRIEAAVFIYLLVYFQKAQLLFEGGFI